MVENRVVYVNIRIPISTVRLMDKLIEKGFFMNRSDLARTGINLILQKYEERLKE